MNTQIVLNCLYRVYNDLKFTDKIIDRHPFQSNTQRLMYKERINNQMREITKVIERLTGNDCKQCKFGATCENKNENGCDKYEQSVLVNCEKCACKDVCYYYRDIVNGTKYEAEYFGADVECPNYIERLD